jgi:trimeric autotransporter adhesin
MALTVVKPSGILTTGNYTVNGINVSANTNTANLTANGIVNFTSTSNVSLGAVGNVKITGGSANYVLATDGTGNLSFTSSTVSINTSSANATYYPLLGNASSGALVSAYVSTTNLTFNPSTGQMTVQDINTLSDATLKEDVEQITDPFTILNQIFGMKFLWKNTGKKSYGVMAQMIEKILPELVSTVNGKKTVNYIPIIAFLVEAVKQQQKDIIQLKKLNKRQ